MEYGGLGLDQARRMKDLEQENARLKRVVADLSLDNLILKEVSTGKFWPARSGGGRLWFMHSRNWELQSAVRAQR